MISTERLRKYPFFGFLKPKELDAVAMIAEEAAYPKGKVIFHADEPAQTLYLLEKGSVELYYESFDEFFKPELRRQFLVGEINPGEVFGISALIDPYQMTAGAVTATPCQVIQIDAEKLRALPEHFPGLECVFYQQALQTLKERLHYTRVQLAAARA
ncbi:MAG TPA: Crp/Fnr family transcriptional regulator [Anaerolineales bacterium]|nr:Crp/Fnr family transcriptional regulator [Anaerolineales bacterium]